MEVLLANLNELSKAFHAFQIKVGFTDSDITKRLMLVITEVSEAFEAYRKGKRANIALFEEEMKGVEDSLYPNEAYKYNFEYAIKDSLEDEIADSIMRLLAFCGENNIDIEKHITLKYKYNQLRGFKYGGKKF